MSYMDGLGTPEQHVLRAAELDMHALAFTEHGNVSSFVQLEKHAIKYGIKPIFGLEAYTAPSNMREMKSTKKWHMTMLASDQIGYKSLNRLVTRSFAEGFYQWPTITGEMFAEDNDGIIATSGCADSLLSCSIIGGKGIDPLEASEARGLRTAARFRALLGDRYYIEVQQFPELERTRALNPILGRIADKLHIPLVATADIHYPHKNDNDIQLILHAAGRGAGNISKQAEGWEYDVRLTFPESDEEVLNRLVNTGLSKKQAGAAFRSTGEIASRCNVTLPKLERLRYPGTEEDMKPW